MILQTDIENVIKSMSGVRFTLHDEITLHLELGDRFSIVGQVEKEVSLSKSSIVDFFFNGIAIEVKVKGGKKAIYNQFKRYCNYPQVEALILVTGISLSLPKIINNKPCFVVKLSNAWL